MGNLTLDRLVGPPPQPEYPLCARCPKDLPKGHSGSELCKDCQNIEQISNHKQRLRGAVHAAVPAFEVSLHYSSKRWQRGNQQSLRAEINRAGFVYLPCCIDTDEITRRWLSDALGHYTWPVVTVTSYGRLLAHWAGEQAGLQPDRYSHLQVLWEQVQAGKAKPLSF